MEIYRGRIGETGKGVVELGSDLLRVLQYILSSITQEILVIICVCNLDVGDLAFFIPKDYFP